MLDYVATLVPPVKIRGLSLAEQHFSRRSNCLEDGSHLLAGEGRRLGRVSLDPAAIELICAVLENSGRPIHQMVNKILLDQHAAPSGGVELVNPYYHWTTMDHLAFKVIQLPILITVSTRPSGQTLISAWFPIPIETSN